MTIMILNEENSTMPGEKMGMPIDPAKLRAHFECQFLNNAISSNKAIKRNYVRIKGLNPLADEYCRALTVFYESVDSGGALYEDHLRSSLSAWDESHAGNMITHDERERAFTTFRNIWENLWMPMFRQAA